MTTASTRTAARGAVVEVNDLRKSYGGRTVVDGVSFTVEEGEIFGILGPNGAGKTTTVECVEGLRSPTRAGSGSPGSTRSPITRQ